MNTNCLVGWKCPKCKWKGPFLVAATVQLRVYDDGTEDAGGDQSWEDDSYARCEGCDFDGIVSDFTTASKPTRRKG